MQWLRLCFQCRGCWFDPWLAIKPQLATQITNHNCQHKPQTTTVNYKSALAMLLFSRWVLSDSSQPHELQHARLPCPSVSPGVCSNSCPLSRWCYLPSTTTRINSRAVAAADLQYSGGRSPGWREGVRHSVPGGVGERTVPIGLRIAWYFQKLILWAQFLYLPISRRALKSFMAMTVPHD